jgi:Zn-dependent protease with chaperone function
MNPVMTCPKCGHQFPHDQLYISWCDQCLWNINPLKTNANLSVRDKIFQKISKKLSERLFLNMLASVDHPQYLRFYSAWAALLATLSFGCVLALMVSGLYLIFFHWPEPVLVIIGFLIMAAGFLVFPFSSALPTTNVVARSSFPSLYGLVDDIAAVLNTSTVTSIVIDEKFNASIEEIGWGQKKILRLGLPLFWMLDSGSLVGVLAHEMAHTVNGDPLRGRLFSFTGRMFNRLYDLFMPASFWDEGHGIINLFMIPWKLLGYAIAQGVRGMMVLFFRSLWHESQFAEFQADLLAAKVSSTDVMIEGLEVLMQRDTFYAGLCRHALNSGPEGLLDFCKNQMTTLPMREKERLRIVASQPHASLDATHPPTGHRIGFLKANPVAHASVELGKEKYEQLKSELAVLKRDVEEKLVNQYLDALYQR